ncbi:MULTISPECIES: hypothetical protein [Pseudomonas]|jgi:hypothetical protein|uniref:Uncharacterized protein n=1 Tax=Pseudomonas lutea TaxID=243924 RepID=A0ABR9ADE8_9PSED|nr:MULTISPECIES: hypothetical protein [Pseudomonas]MBD8124015.1 hypothetical protein [Pseudomonas lutea]
MLGLRQDHSNSFSAKAGPLDDRDFIVGAGLLANAFCQSTYSFLIRRVRQQAGSYRKMRSVRYNDDRQRLFKQRVLSGMSMAGRPSALDLDFHTHKAQTTPIATWVQAERLSK